ncbi:MAG: AAA family ATPase, partial [Desulfobulbaceae bacterium]|nr:AAA family ATPase [Desulfobulbaceae bacterium]
LLADFLGRIKLLTLLVARSGLGTLNHTLLSLEALRSRDIPVLGVVFSDAENDAGFDELLLADNMRTIAEIGRVTVFGRIKRCADFTEAREEFRPVGRLILQTLKQKIIPELQSQ